MSTTINQETYTGTNGSEDIRGNLLNNYVSLLGGDDLYESAGGSDTIFGGSGDDTVIGGSVVWGERGSDLIVNSQFTMAGKDDDHINNYEVEEFEPIAFGGDGDDLLIGARHMSNQYFGDRNDDSLVGGSKEDLLDGGVGSDFLYGYESYDLLYGGNDDDTLVGAENGDILVGGEGSDDFLFYPVFVQDIDLVIDYEDGIDKLGVTSIENVGWYYDENLGETVVLDTQTELYFTKISGNVMDQLDKGDFILV